MIRILSLDDVPEILNLYSLIVERSGYDHTSSTNRYEAWGATSPACVARTRRAGDTTRRAPVEHR